MVISIDGIPVSGSAGLDTYSRNKYGAYIRRRTKPINPSSTAQNRARGYFTAAVNVWTQTLTDAQRLSWYTYAAAVPWLNTAGQTVFLQAQAHFVRTYTAYQVINGVAMTTLTAPNLNDLGSLNVNFSIEPSVDTPTQALSTTINAPAASNLGWGVAGGIAIVEISIGQNPSRAAVPNRFAVLGQGGIGIGAAAGAWAADAITMAGEDTLLPFSLTVGLKYWLRLRGVSPIADRRVTTQRLLGPFILTETP